MHNAEFRKSCGPDFISYAEIQAYTEPQNDFFAKLYNPKRTAFSLIMHYALCILHFISIILLLRPSVQAHIVNKTLRNCVIQKRFGKHYVCRSGSGYDIDALIMHR